MREASYQRRGRIAACTLSKSVSGHTDIRLGDDISYRCKGKMFTLEQATKAQKVINLGTRWGWVLHATPRPLYPRENTRYPLYSRLGGLQGSVWTGAENLAPTGIRSPDLTARSETLYRLSYPGPILQTWCVFT